jgi:hypothetical protein
MGLILEREFNLRQRNLTSLSKMRLGRVALILQNYAKDFALSSLVPDA